MAKVGEGDPRWVVSDRKDGQNVGNWHWSGERDLRPWAERRLRALIEPVTGADVRVASVSVDGDANIYNRKGKRKVVYDLKVTGEWTTLPSGTEAPKTEGKEKPAHTAGKFITELFVGDDSPDVVVSTDSKSAADPKFKPRFIAQCVPAIITACTTFIGEINAGPDVGEDGAPMPSKEASGKGAPPPLARTPAVPEAKVTDFKRTAGVDVSSAAFRERESAATPLIVRDRFTCSPADLFAAMVGDRARLEAVTRAAATCDPTRGGRWEVLGGAASGTFTEVVDGRKAVLDWRMKDFAEGEKDAKVSVEFNDVDGRTDFVLTVTGLETKRKPSVEGFWRLQLMRPIKLIFGYGNASFL